MKAKAACSLLAGVCFGIYVSHSRKFAKRMSDLAEDIQDKVSAATVVKMIDVLLGEVVHTTIVSTQRITDFLLDIRSAVSQLETNTEH